MKTRRSARRAGGEAAQAARPEENLEVGVLAQAMGARMGVDLSGVRFHAGGDAARSAEGMGARAYTVGQDVCFGAGELETSSREGKGLIAHELVHTVQNRGGGGGVAMKSRLSQAGDAAEEEADRLADALVDGVGPVEVRERPSAEVHRKSKPVFGEPELDEEEPEPAPKEEEEQRGFSGLRQRSTPCGKLIHPLSSADVDGKSVKDLNRYTDDLISGLGSLDRGFLAVVSFYRDSDFFYDDAMLDVEEINVHEVGKEIEFNLDDKTADQAKDITNVAMHMDVINLLIKDSQRSLETASKKLRSAKLHGAAAKNWAKVRRLEEEIASTEKAAGWIGSLAKTAVAIALDPMDAVKEGVDILIEVEAELAAQVVNLDAEAEKAVAEERAEEQEEEANETDEEIAHDEAANARRFIGELRSTLEDVQGRVDTRARSAEKLYDKTTIGSFKFADLRKHADEAGQWADRALDVRRSAQFVKLREGDVRAALGARQGDGQLKGAPEVVEEHIALSAILSRADQEEIAVSVKGDIFRDVQKETNDKIAELDKQMMSAAEHHDYSPE